MDVFELRNRLTEDYSSYAGSFIQIQDSRIKEYVNQHFDAGVFWPAPLIQLNPSFASGGSVNEMVAEDLLHPECNRIFQKNKQLGGQSLRFHLHQRQAIETARKGHNYILTTGTGSGKSLGYIVPIVDHVLRRGSGKGIQAIIVYPMNALANSQVGELKKFLMDGYPKGIPPVTFDRYTGQESEEERRNIIANPPDILLTNYVMLELIMTRPRERQLIEKAVGLRFLVLDELHTYRGRQGADVALLVRRVRDRLETPIQKLLCVGTSATLVSEGSFLDQKEKIAQVGTQIFGTKVLPEHVIGETLQRTTRAEIDKDALVSALKQGDSLIAPNRYTEFVNHPLSIWIEKAFGLQETDGRLTRQYPRSIQAAAQELSHLTELPVDICERTVQNWLTASYNCERNPDTGFAPFAFRLHQFISPGDTVYASIEPETTRHLTLYGQRFVPGEREKVLFPLCFCRECGQEYYSVHLTKDQDGQEIITPRDFSDRLSDDDDKIGYVYISTHKPWPRTLDDILNESLLPDDWLEIRKGNPSVRQHRRSLLPRHIRVISSGMLNGEGQECVYINSPFMFCLNCGVSYAARQSDFGKLATLSSEGRSSATTLLSLSAIRSLKVSDLPLEARKLLSFTDNRQDASLQAGHFNDFVEVSLLRGAIYSAVLQAGNEGLTHELIAEKVYEALNLPIALYASDPDVRFQALHETQRALRQVLGYRIYRDLRRGWRIALPNLEQCGLLEIGYADLDAVCQAEDVWQAKHPALSGASPQTRVAIAKTLLDYMRRELAIKVDYLDKTYQERMQQLSSQRLCDPWAIDEDEKMEYASILLPRSFGGEEGSASYTYVSGRGGFGMYLRRPNTFPDYDATSHGRIGVNETEIIIRELLEGLKVAGLVEVVLEPKDKHDVSGYQLVASSMRWYAGNGNHSFHDPIRVPKQSQTGGHPNLFFVDFYSTVAKSLVGLEAHEHTAQVPYDEREKREKRFRTGDLPILYCSPTMELGVDIADLNVVNLRNVPPTPANYAQRSGRAGRSGQPALVFTYCASRSPHDQFFFNRPERMVSGAVTPPRLDLSNEDLLRAHIHAIWLSETGIDLKDTLKEILDIMGDPPSLTLLPEILQQAESTVARQSARQKAERVLSGIEGVDSARLIEATILNIVLAFDDTCNRWRELYRSALRQADSQNKIIRDASRSSTDKQQATRLRREAESQMKLLTEMDKVAQSDFYSYRYFATEGFLPGYSFPRLPISAFIPARRANQRDNFLSRPRFLAISEFGPRAIIYHEGSKYLINQVIMPVTDDEEGPLTSQIKQCERCGYIHPVKSDQNYDLCERCQSLLGQPLTSLLRLQNVVTRRRDRINADEEDRLRLGYDIRTGIRFTERDGIPDTRTASVSHDGQEIVRLTYAQTATLWRVNLGWARRKEKNNSGFVLDIERGYWGKNDQDESDTQDPMSPRTKRVIPYVEDSRNSLLFEPLIPLKSEEIASLQAALKRAIESIYQLEDNELAVEPLPDRHNRRIILFYEAAEGGAGVLRRLVDEPDAMRKIVQEALRLCHFDPETGEDQHRASRSKEDCEAACYDCLLSYGNQREHSILDRQLIRDVLMQLAESSVSSSPTGAGRDSHFTSLINLCESDLEREWLTALHKNGLRLPDSSQVYIETCKTRPDFVYESNGVYAAIYIDGSHHDFPNRKERDRQQVECMEDYGYQVIRFNYSDNWPETWQKHKHIFGGEA